ncbi:DNA polymerase III subunit beta [Helicobacter didelphidarum]|uniref:Beta sliding clamp n=2 Tax=Helicobacter didelphidarum TaxID=2040648 RepID=A0A3D8IM62_9HELI|nr:DNA polymerase III subunit beta [Helicobacter didelphidarum]
MQNAINKKYTIDITSNIMFETIDNKLILKATDHELYIKSTLTPKSLNGNISCAINGELIINVMKSLNDSEIILEETEEFLYIKQNKSSFKLPIFEINDFPFNESYTKMEKINLDNDMLLQSIKKISHCCSDKDTLNIAMQGILLEIKNSSLNIVATDSKRLGFIRKEYNENIQPLSCIIPKKAINELLKLFNNSFEFYIKRFEEDNKIETIGIIHENLEFYSKLINANYPNYENLINTKPQVTPIQIEKDKLLRALNQMNSICTRVKVTFNPNEIILETLEGLNGASASNSIENIQTHITESKQTGLVNRHILECISNIKFDDIEIFIDDPNRPIFIVSKDFEEIIMPQII